MFKKMFVAGLLGWIEGIAFTFGTCFIIGLLTNKKEVEAQS